jgi:hypothetical protein
VTPPPVRGWLTAPIVAAALLFAPMPAALVDRLYSRVAFPRVQTALTSLSNLAPFAALDVLLVGSALLVLWRLAQLVGLARRLDLVEAGWDAIRRVVRAAGVVTILFLCLWGLNYRRTPLDVALHGAAAMQPSAKELRAAITDANGLAARVRPAALARGPLTFDEIARRLPTPVNVALARVGRAPLAVPGRPKYSLVLTPFFTWAGVNGMINPLALESIVDPGLLPIERPFVLAHEWAHLAGQADEAEASAVGWLACMQGGPEFTYSASLYLIMESSSVLTRPVWREVSATLDAGVRADLAAIAERATRERPVVRQTAFRVYDTYLRANRVEDGVASYNRALALILAPPLRDALAGSRRTADRQP